MDTETRRELLDVLDEAGKAHPAWRFGELVVNLAAYSGVDPSEIEDEELIRVAKDRLQNLSDLFDPAELERRSKWKGRCYTTAEVLERLRALEMSLERE